MTKATSAYLNKPLRSLEDVQMKHTPGPWYVETVPTSIGHCHKIQPVNACLYVDYRGIRATDPKTAVAEANARLIAAAPELLEALEKMLHEATKIGAFDEDAERRLEQRPEFIQARAAIAKATEG